MRLNIELTEQEHRQLKAVAAMQGKTMREYVLERLFDATGSKRPDKEAVKAGKLDALLEEGFRGPMKPWNLEEFIADIGDKEKAFALLEAYWDREILERGFEGEARPLDEVVKEIKEAHGL